MAPPLDFAAVFEASPNPYMLLDRELRYVAANPAYLRVTHSRLEDLLGRNLFDAFPHDPGDLDNGNARRLRASFEKVLSSGQPDVLPLISYRIQVSTPEGPRDEELYWSVTHTPVRDAAGDVAYILQHTVNVTELHRQGLSATQEMPGKTHPLVAQTKAGVLGRAEVVQRENVTLTEQIQHLRSVFEQAPGFITLLRGPDHVFELANKAYRQMVGDDRELLGKPVREALPEVSAQGFLELLDGVYRTGEPFIGRGVPVVLQRSPDAPPEKLFLDFIYQPVVGPDGQPLGIFVQGYDTTAEKRLEEERGLREAERVALLERERAARTEAEHASRLKDEFLATVSHELRTPLTAMLGWLQMLRLGRLPEERREKALETVERNARAQAQLVEDLLDVSRIMSGKMALELARVNVAEVVDAALEVVRPAADAKEISLHGRVDGTVELTGDPGRLQQVVWNLLSNAVKFTPRGGRVEVEVARRDGMVEVRVSDDGQGIAPEFLPHVFERFRQADSGTTRRHGGLGLGLAIVKHLAELHGGVVSAASDGPGRGTTLTVRLPVTATRPAPSPLVLSTGPGELPFQFPPEVSGLHLLVVDDKADTRELVRSWLEQCGAHVQTAASATTALEALRRGRPDILISDLAMPDEEGYHLIRALRALPEEEGGRTPAVALTASVRSEERIRALMAGFKANVPKPLDAAELLAVIASVAPAKRR
jgi:signal transduction histidine kinase/ActR/RegA family two-component response regulator